MIVFVSYSSVNRERVENLVVQFGALGHDVEYEIKYVGAPITWGHVLSRIRECHLFVATLTPASLASYSCEIEYQYAQALGKNILPILLEDITILGAQLEPVVDMRYNSSQPQVALERAIAELPESRQPVNAPVNTEANWITPLAELRERINLLSTKFEDQRLILLNIREFLERRETLEVARSLLDFLALRTNLNPAIASEIDVIRNDLMQSRQSMRVAQRQSTIIGAVFLSSIVAIVVFVLSQQLFRLRADRSVALVSTSLPNDQLLTQVTPSQLQSPNLLEATMAVLPIESTIVPTNSSLLATNTASLSSDALTTKIPIPQATSAASLSVTDTKLTPITQLESVQETEATKIATVTSPLSISMTPTQSVVTSFFNASAVLSYQGMDVEDTSLGLLVKTMGTSAKGAGLKQGDYILAIDLQIVTKRDEFIAAMQQFGPFSRVTLRIRREGRIEIVNLTLLPDDFRILNLGS